MVGGVEETNRVPKIFSRLFSLYVVMCHMVVNNIFPTGELGLFTTKFLWTPCSYWKYKCAFCVLLYFKNSRWIIPWWSCHMHNITLHGGQLGRFILVSSLPFALSIVICNLFSLPVIYLSNTLFLCHERKHR